MDHSLLHMQLYYNSFSYSFKKRVTKQTPCYVLCVVFHMPKPVHLGIIGVDQLGLTIQCYSLFRLIVQIL